MDTPETATVEVTQDDRDLFCFARGLGAADQLARIATGAYDDERLMQMIARHRIRATRQDGLREARDDRKAVNGVLAGLLAPLIPNPAELIAVGNRACTEILAALSDSSTREESGADTSPLANKTGRFAAYSTGSLSVQCRMQARDNLDPEYSQFMLAVADRLDAESLEETFEQAWARMEAEGYNYGRDALENVRFGWELAKGISDDRAALSASPEGEGK